ncbi:MAG: DUF4292 domain-containing protein [Bacteroidota bacterium]
MREYNRILPLLTIAMGMILLGVGCKTIKGVGNSDKVPKKLDRTIQLVQERSPEFNTLSISGKAKVDIPEEGMGMRISYRLNMYKDSLIWIRVSKLGIEAVRVLITKDSVFALDNINERYVRSGFDPANKFTGLTLDFPLLQDLVLGNLNLIPRQISSPSLEGESDQFELEGNENGTAFTYTIDKDWLKLKKIHAYNPTLSQETEISYGDFQKLGKGLLPQQGVIRVTQPQQVNLDFTHARVRVNPERMSVKFNIPKGYSLVSG